MMRVTLRGRGDDEGNIERQRDNEGNIERQRR